MKESYLKTEGMFPRGRSGAARIRSISCVVMIICLLFFSAAKAAPERSGLPDIFPADKVESGMRGRGYTSFKGRELEEFHFEVLGVLRSYHPGGRLFLVELEHPQLKDSGVIAGMSGSPVYIEDQLLGAVAYGFSGSLKPIAGVTPAGEMRIPFEMETAESQRASSVAESKSRARRYILKRISRAGEKMAGRSVNREELKREMFEAFIQAPYMSRSSFRSDIDIADFKGLSSNLERDFEGVKLQPLPMPLSFSGIEIGRIRNMSSIMRPAGFMPVHSPDAGSMDSFDDSFEVPEELSAPGTPVGSALLTGDIDIAGMGTLTFSDGKRIAAFGHPMVGTGNTDLPMALGYVEAVVPARTLSFRLTSSRQIIGRITQDRESAIVGEIGEDAPMFPITVKVTGAHDSEYNFKATGHWEFAPTMALYATALSALRWDGESELVTVEASSRIKLRGRDEPIELENRYAYSPTRPAFEMVMIPVQTLLLNPFEDVEIEAIDVELNMKDSVEVAVIEAIQVEKQRVSPGETLNIWTTLRTFQGPARVKKISFEIPQDARPGTVAKIRVSDALEVMSDVFSSDPGLLRPESLEVLIESLEVMPHNTHLFATGDFERRGLRYDEEPMPALPGSFMNILQHSSIKGKTSPLREAMRSSRSTPWVIEGGLLAEVEIVD